MLYQEQSGKPVFRTFQESYYDDGKVNLEDALRGFFSHLYQRMFVVFNAQHTFDST
jgi:hypothetical protein